LLGGKLALQREVQGRLSLLRLVQGQVCFAQQQTGAVKFRALLVAGERNEPVEPLYGGLEVLHLTGASACSERRLDLRFDGQSKVENLAVQAGRLRVQPGLHGHIGQVQAGRSEDAASG
jgi:hypothetical protein